MKRAILLLTLSIQPTALWAQDGRDCEPPTCEAGFTWDAETSKCVEIVSS